MSALSKPVTALIGAVAVLFAGLFFATSSGAYPSSTPAALSVSDTTPAAGSTVTVTGSNYQPDEDVSIELHSAVVSEGTVTADDSGSFTTSVSIPSSFSGSHEIVGTGLTSGEVAAVEIDVNSSGTSNGGTSSGGLSSTGVAVIGIGALGVVLLAGGGLLLLAGRRRKVSV